MLVGALGCGGKVIWVSDGGAGGTGNTGASGTTVTNGATTTGAVTTSGVTTGEATVAVAVSATSTGSGPFCGVNGSTDTCQHACEAIYECGLMSCGGSQVCPGFTGSPPDKAAFMNGPNGCVGACNQQPALKSLVDPTDCQSTIDTIESVSDPFKQECVFGFMEG